MRRSNRLSPQFRAAQDEIVRQVAERDRETKLAATQAEIDYVTPHLTVAEIAARRGVLPSTIRNSIKHGTLVATDVSAPKTPPEHRQYRISEAQYDAYLIRLTEKHQPHRYRVDPDVYDRRHKEGWLTWAEAAKHVGVSRARLEKLAPSRKIAVEWEGIRFMRKTDAQRLLDERISAFLSTLDLDTSLS